MRLLERRWVVGGVALVLFGALAMMVGFVEAQRRAVADALFEQTADDVVSSADAWFDEQLTWQRDLAFDLSRAPDPATPDAANTALAAAVGDSIAQFALWLDADGRVIATFPVRADLQAGTDLRGVFPHFDAVLDGASTAMWATDESATSSGRVVALVTRPSPTGDLLSVAFDPADTPLDGLVAAAAGRLGGAGTTIVEPVTGAAMLELSGDDTPSYTTEREAVEGLAVLTYRAPVVSVEAAVGGVELVPGRIALGIAAVLLAVLVVVLPRWARRAGNERAARIRTDAIIDGSPVPTAELTGSGHVVRVNHAFADLFGWDRDDLRGEDLVATAIAAEDREVARGLAERNGATAEVSFVTRSGRRGTGRLSLVSLDEHDTLVAQLEDLTELVATQRALDRSREDLRLFAGRVAHDLNNPLTAASGLADAMTRMDLPREQQQELLGRIAASTASAIELVRRLYDTADRVGGEAWRGVELSEMVDEVTRLRAVTLAETKGSIDLDVERAAVVVPPELLRTVLGNLVDNALKYRRDSVAPRITLTDVADADGVHLVLRDNGSGVAEADLVRIFHEGVSVHDAGEGHGSGLAECRRMLERVGGQIWAEPAGDHGLAVHVTLPQSVPATVDADRAVPAPG